jgi:hypothetical protein
MTQQLGHIRFPQPGDRFHFVRHLVEMMVAMWIGMPLGRVLFASSGGRAAHFSRCVSPSKPFAKNRD